MSLMTSLTDAERAKLARAQALQARRERWMATLQSLPQPKTEMEPFPYADLDEALDDGFRKIKGGSAGFFKMAVNAWKTKQWREQAERNRAARDAAAELEAAKAELEKVDDEIAKLAETVAEMVR